MGEKVIPMPLVREVKFDDTNQILRNFENFVSTPREKNDVECAAMASLPVFKMLLQQLKTWDGDIKSLPESDVLLEALTEYTESLTQIMEKDYEH